MDTTITLHKENIELFLERLENLNRKLEKKNQPKVEYFVSGFTTVIGFNGCELPVLEITLRSAITTTNIKGVDVKFEGVVDLINQEENSKVYHFDNPEIQKLLPECECDECHKRIGRNKYIVFSKIGKEVTSRKDLFVLGSKCAKNYFPFNVESYIGYLGDELNSFWDMDETRGGQYSYLNRSVDLEQLYLATCDATNNLAFYKKECETKTDVSNLVFDRKYKPSEPKVPFATVKEWLIGAYSKDDSDFGSNIRSVIMETGCYIDRRFTPYDTPKLRERVDIKQLGLAIYSFIGAKKWYDREVEKKLAEERKLAKDAVLEYFGNVGDKFQKELIFDKIFGYETMYGYSYIILFHDEENHVFKWSTGKGTYQCWHKTSGRNAYLESEVGRKYLIKGSIKEHSEYNGTKQTVITRCKVLGDEYESHVFSYKDVQKEEVKPTEAYEDPFDTLFQIMDKVSA